MPKVKIKKAQNGLQLVAKQEPLGDVYEYLRQRGVPEALARKLSDAVPKLREEFPEPRPEVIAETVKVVAEVIWANQHWPAIFGAPPEETKKERLRRIAEEIVVSLVSSGLWSLLCYVAWALGTAAKTGGIPMLNFSSNQSVDMDAELFAYRRELVEGKIFSGDSDLVEPPTTEELFLSELAFDNLFQHLDQVALLDSDLRMLIQGRAAIGGGFQSPSRTLFGFLQAYEPKTGLTAEDLPIAFGRIKAKINAAQKPQS
jgi:hypothetical protein